MSGDQLPMPAQQRCWGDEERRLGVHFARVEPFTQAGKYVRGLMSDLPRNNC
jgi:hypothetical protein